MLGDFLAGGVIWVIGSLAIYWNLESKGVLPSNDHVRVLAVTWPLTFVAFCVWGLLKSTRFVTKTVVVDTVISFKTIADLRLNEGRLLMPPKPRDEADRLALEEVNRLAPEA
jgi:tetrahydromethanopterin S-methyltransferase subunit C